MTVLSSTTLGEGAPNGKSLKKTPLAFHLEKEPSTPYLYEPSEARGIQVIEDMAPTWEKVRQNIKDGGSKRARKKKKKAAKLYIPLVLDTEFQTVPSPDHVDFHDRVLKVCQSIGRGSIPITTQIKAITEQSEVGVYLHPEFKKAFPKAQPEGVIVSSEPIADYIGQCLGQKVRFQWLETVEDSRYRIASDNYKLRIHIFAHFALAEILRIFGNPQINDHIRDLCRAADGREEPWIQSGRRLKTTRKIGANPKPQPWVPIPIIVRLGGKTFAVEISVYDNSAMLGQAGASLAGFHQVAGLGMVAKDNYQKVHKEKMLLQFIGGCDQKGLEAGAYRSVIGSNKDLCRGSLVVGEGDPTVFLDYAKGDVLTLYKAIRGVVSQINRVYDSLGLSNYYRDPKPTTGSTVHDLIKAAIFQRFENCGAFQNQCFFLSNSERKGLEKGAYYFEDFRARKGRDPAFLTYPYWYDGEALPLKLQRMVQNLGFKPAEAQLLAAANDWSGLNAKVMGGRCISAAPCHTGVTGKPIADVDLSGCYVAAMYQQQMPLGRPIIIGGAYKRNSKRNNYQTLRQFLNSYEEELVPSLWQAWISCEDRDGKPLELPCDQDYFPSWDAPPSFFDFKEDEEGLWLERNDQVRHYLREITNTVLTHDGLQWLRNVASKPLREFILDHGKVKTAMFYPACERVSDEREFIDRFVEYEEERLKKEAEEADAGNTSKAVLVKRRSKVVDQQQEFHAWFSVDLDGLIADGLKKKRAEWKVVTGAYKAIKGSAVQIKTEADLEKVEPGDRTAIQKALNSDTLGTYPGGLAALIEESGRLSKHPLDELYKLTGNTVYGVVVSRFFALSNPVVGNNITARCRHMIALYQGACRGWNAITDGGLMNLNRVFYPKKDRTLTEKATLLVEASSREVCDAHMKSGPIGQFTEGCNFKEIRWEGDELVFEGQKGSETRRFHKSQRKSDEEAGTVGYLDFIDGLILDHVKGCYDIHRDGITDIDVLDGCNQDGWESPFKFESKGVVQDACIHGAGNYFLQGGWHEGYKKDGPDHMVKMRSYPSAVHESRLIPFFKQMLKDPSRIDRTVHSQPFTTSKILKIGDYNQGYEAYYKHTIAEPGDTVHDVKMFRELGLTGFRFRNRKQEKHWRRDHERNRIVDRNRPSIGQSYEGYYIDENNVLDYRRMLTEINAAITRGLNNLPGRRDQSPIPHREVKTLQEMKRRYRQMLLKNQDQQLTFEFDPYIDDPYSAASYRDQELSGDYVEDPYNAEFYF